MSRARIVWLVACAALALLVFLVARNTYWDEMDLPATLRGEAARNPLYAAESLATHLGGTASKDSLFPSPAPDAVIYLANWTWDLGEVRRGQLERWVESGGRLVIDATVHFQQEIFQRWSGIEYFEPEISEEERRRRASEEGGGCDTWKQAGSAPIPGDRVDRSYVVCSGQGWERVRASRRVLWSVRDRDGMLALRVQVGEGSVTALAGQPFQWRGPLQGDQAELFVAATQLRGGDRIHFLSETRHPSLVALAWRYGAPAIVLAALALLLALWRNATRFGPLLPAPQPLRRSLLEQIRGTGQFALRYGGGAALHAASVRAARTAAMRRIPGFASMNPAEQTAAMARAASLDADAMGAALQAAVPPRSISILSTLALLETVRRRILSGNPGQNHG